MATRITELHKEVHDHIEQSNAKYKSPTDKKRRPKDFQVGYLVMIYLRKSQFPMGTYNKLKQRKLGPFQIVQRFGSNAYKIQLPPDYNISPIFNVADIYSYQAPDDFTLAT